MPLVQTNEKIANAIFNHGHNMSLAKCSVAKIIEAQYKGLFLWKRPHYVYVDVYTCLLIVLQNNKQ